jgi:hypothetical protein
MLARKPPAFKITMAGSDIFTVLVSSTKSASALQFIKLDEGTLTMKFTGALPKITFICAARESLKGCMKRSTLESTADVGSNGTFFAVEPAVK